MTRLLLRSSAVAMYGDKTHKHARHEREESPQNLNRRAADSVAQQISVKPKARLIEALVLRPVIAFIAGFVVGVCSVKRGKECGGLV
jgi:hypothetical protein